MANLVCPTNGKDYILPTKAWLEPLEVLISQDIATRGKLIISELLKANKVLVKLTSGRNHHIKEFLDQVKGLPNLVNTYCIFFCNDDFLLIQSEKQYCSLETKNDTYYKDYLKKLGKAKNYNYSVTLEVMEYYNLGSIKSLKNISYNKFLNILFQLVFCQLNVFGKTGYTHNDIHEGNIIIKKHETEQIFNYKYITSNCVDKSNEYNLKSNYEFILADYDKIFYFRKDYFDKYYGDVDASMDNERFLQYSLFSNLLETINKLIEKLNDKDKQIVRDKLNIVLDKYEEVIFNLNKQIVIAYTQNGNFKEFIAENIKINCYFIKKLIKLFQTQLIYK